MIELTEEMRKAVREQNGTPIRLVDPATQEMYVLLRSEEYERLTDDDDSSWTDEEREMLRAEAVEALGSDGMEAYADDDLPDAAALMNEVMAEDDVNDPYLEGYQHYAKESQ